MTNINISVSVADGKKIPVYSASKWAKWDMAYEISPNTTYRGIHLKRAEAIIVKWKVPEGVDRVEINFPRVEQNFSTMSGVWVPAVPESEDLHGFLGRYGRFVNLAGDYTDVPIPGTYVMKVWAEYYAAYEKEDAYVDFDFEVLMYTSKQEEEIGTNIGNIGTEIRNQNEQTGNQIEKQVNTATDEVKKYLTDLQTRVSNLESSVSDAIYSAMSTLEGHISGMLGSIGVDITTSIASVAKVATERIESAIFSVSSFLRKSFEGISSVLSSIYQVIREFLERIWKFIVEVLAKAIAEFVRWFIQTMEKFPTRFAEAFASVVFEEVEE
jgi:hypothetical protein